MLMRIARSIGLETRSQLGSPVLVLLDLETAGAGRSVARIPVARLDDVRDWRDGRGYHGL